MRVGKFALKLVCRYQNRLEKQGYKRLPDLSIYRPLWNVDVTGEGKFRHQMDILYSPNNVRKNRVVVYIHGGAYLFCSRKGTINFGTRLLDAGYDFVSLDYEPNKGKHGCHEQAKQIASQIRYVMNHADELGLNKNAMVLDGDSAGGHFALLMAELSCDPELQKETGIDLGGASFLGVAAHCPVYDVVRSTQAASMSKSGRKYMFGPKFNDDVYYSLISPKAHLGSLKIPAFVSTCKHDFIGQESKDLHADFEKASKPLRFIYLDTDAPKVEHVHNVVAPELAESVYVNEVLIDFVNGLFPLSRQE